jgi:eukaryotic-like serine/threonine-protein kinase
MLRAELGRSDSGLRFEATAIDPRAGEPTEAALVLIDLASTRAPAFQQRFASEMLPLRRLTHPNIARHIDAGVHAGMVYHTQELVRGQSLAAMLQSLKPGDGLDWAAVVAPIAVQIARALKHAHHRSILHRDLKPATVIMLDSGAVKVIDFGVAKVLNVPPLSMPAEPVGSPAYLAPEYFTGKPPTRKSDLYSLGGVLYTLATGHAPFTAATAAEYLHKHCYMLPERPINRVPKLPVEVDEFLCSLLAKDPARRPVSAAAVLDELDRIRGKLERSGRPVAAPPDAIDPTGQHAPLSPEIIAATTPEAASRRDRSLRAAVIGALLLLVLGVMLFAFFRPRPSADELWQQAAPLLESDDPADWETARDEYLDRIERWHPGAYAGEIEATRQRIRDRRELRRAIESGSTVTAGSHAERLYRKGLAAVLTGDFEMARTTWTALITEFPGESDRKWARLAHAGLDELDSAKRR